MKFPIIKTALAMFVAVSICSCKDQKAEDAKLRKELNLMISAKVKIAIDSVVKKEVRRQLRYQSSEEMRRVAQQETENQLRNEAMNRQSQNEAVLRSMGGY